MGSVSSDRQRGPLLLILTCATQRRAIVQITSTRNGSISICGLMCFELFRLFREIQRELTGAEALFG